MPLIVGAIVADLTLPARHLPWRTLDIDERAGFSTGIKLSIMDIGPDSWCDRLLQRSASLQTSKLQPLADSDGCGWSNAYHIEKSGAAALSGQPPHAMQCPLAAAAHIWLTSVELQAQEIFGVGLKRAHHAGTYSCRRMYNRSSGRMSQHAYANAWDVTGFELNDGQIVSVEKHWNSPGPAQQFLRAVRDDACDIFRVVLGPDHNAAHHDHFHVDMGMGATCD